MASRKTEGMKQRLLEERDRLLRQREALDNQIIATERAIMLVGGNDDAGPSAQAGRRSSTKSVALDLLEEVGTTGLNAATAVEIADRRGLTLDRASVSSLLSRLKKDGVVVYDGERYRLKKYARAEDLKPEASREDNAHPFPVLAFDPQKAQHNAT